MPDTKTWGGKNSNTYCHLRQNLSCEFRGTFHINFFLSSKSTTEILYFCFISSEQFTQHQNMIIALRNISFVRLSMNRMCVYRYRWLIMRWRRRRVYVLCVREWQSILVLMRRNALQGNHFLWSNFTSIRLNDAHIPTLICSYDHW